MIEQDWVLVLGLGLLLRLALMPITWHNDAVWVPWMANLIVDGAPNVYQELLDRFGPAVLSPTVWAPYLPYYYLLMAGWTGLLDVLGLADVSVWTFSYAGWNIPDFPRSVFLVKLPLLAADLAIWGLILSLLAPSKRRRFSWLYLFSPAVLWVSFVMGQNDVLPTLATVASVWFAAKSLRTGRSAWSLGAVLCLGFGGGVKSYPLLLLVPTALILGQSAAQTLGLVVAGLIPFAIAVIPYLGTPAFVQGALLNHEGMSLTKLVLGSGLQAAPVFVVVYGLLMIYLVFGSQPRTVQTLSLAYAMVVACMLVLSAWPFNWLLWLVPFLAWMIVEHNLPDILYASVGLYFCAFVTAWGKPVGGYTFYPLGQSLRYFVPFSELVGRYLDLQRAQGWLFAFFVIAILAILALALFRRRLRPKLGWSFGVWSAVGPALALAATLVYSTAVGHRGFAVREQRDRSGSPIPLGPDTLVEQSLEIEIDGLRAFDVWVLPPLPSKGELQLLRHSDQGALAPVHLDAIRLHANTWNRFELGEVYPAGEYRIALQWTGEAPLHLAQSQADSLPGSTLYVNGNETSQDLACRAIADADWSTILSTAVGRLGQDLAFTLLWVTSLVVLAAAVAWAAIVRRKRPSSTKDAG